MAASRDWLQLFAAPVNSARERLTDVLHLKGASQGKALFVLQAATTALAVCGSWIALDGASALAALFGGLVAIVPALYFAVRVSRARRGSRATEVLGIFYQAELGKLVLTAVLFVIGAFMFGKHFGPLMLTCIACLAMNWVLLAVATID